MKRPQGFEARPPRRPPLGGATPSAVRPAARVPAARPGDAGGAADRVGTEPIAVVAGAGVGAPRAARDLQETVPLDDVRRGLLAGAGPHDTAAEGPPALPEPPGDAKGARRAVAAAERARRRYEKQEVRRFTKRSRRRRLVWAVVGGALALLVVVVVGGAYSPLMALREVRVEGAARIPPEQIVAAFEDELGTPLPLVTRDDVHRSLADFRLIETYSTETIPPGTLVVRIVERTPVGVIETARGLELVDGAGVVIERPEARPDGQPLIETPGGTASDGFRAVAAVVRSLPAEVRALLVGASAETADDVRLELAGGVPVVWGGAGDSSTKAAVLARLMVVAPPDTVSGYDVSSPESAVTY
ncbi:FtsQ-type POTRA domain-containing protein [Agromyces lapidis]|uniref:FtsQ-type POTRA domain-containing protein n=1 Tax=Agromyces lapidis TaxID=279574 RepID=A0ABV5SYB3_9MICO|nr:FtsQ-type POTRA domain-containing protein [Agromyces lapidis]